MLVRGEGDAQVEHGNTGIPIAVFSGHPHLDHFRFVKDHAKVAAKMTIPAPSTLHFRQGRQSISKQDILKMAGNFDEVEDRQKVLRIVYEEFRREYSSSIE